MVSAVVASAIVCEVNLSGLARGLSTGVDFMLGMFPPEWEAVPGMLWPALTTVLLALIATPLAVVISLLVALAGAANVGPGWLRVVARTLMATERALPDTVVALFFVAALGPGPAAGIIALALGSIGMLGKLFADSIEELEPGIVESLQSVGASKMQIIRYAVLPEVLPSVIANSLFRFEINIRNSALLGAVGAGGIGYVLNEAMNLLEYRRASTAIVLTVALVFITERASHLLRKRLLKGGSLQ
jgi:phosphonate transport system permease protein